MTEKLLSAPSGKWILSRFPQRQKELLRAWDAADEYVLQHLSERPPAPGRLLIANDSFGALSTALNELAPVNWSDSWLAHEGLRANLATNQLNAAQVMSLPSTTTPNFCPQLTIIKVPKTLALLEDQLCRLQPLLAANSRVILAGMAKAMTSAVWQMLERIIGPTQTGPTRKKAQLIEVTVDNDLPRADSPYPTRWPLVGTPFNISNHANVFSRQKLDIGTRFMLEHLTLKPHQQDIIDLGCGNGILGLTAGASNTEANVHFIDESYMAIESARDNFTQINPSLERGRFYLGDGLSGFEHNSADLILCNPPFHQSHAIGDTVALTMFQDAAQVLRKDGELWVVGNRHLGYHIKLKRWFSDLELLASNSKFVLFRARQNR